MSWLHRLPDAGRTLSGQPRPILAPAARLNLILSKERPYPSLARSSEAKRAPHMNRRLRAISFIEYLFFFKNAGIKH